MSDHGSGDGGSALLLTLGLLSIPAATVLQKIYMDTTLTGLTLFFGLCVLFPLGLWIFAKSHMGH